MSEACQVIPESDMVRLRLTKSSCSRSRCVSLGSGCGCVALPQLERGRTHELVVLARRVINTTISIMDYPGHLLDIDPGRASTPLSFLPTLRYRRARNHRVWPWMICYVTIVDAGIGGGN